MTQIFLENSPSQDKIRNKM